MFRCDVCPGFHSVAGCPELRSLNLSNCIQVTDSVVDMITDRCRLLENFNLSSCHAITPAAIDNLVSRPWLHVF